jgi:hypothetical protein
MIPNSTTNDNVPNQITVEPPADGEASYLSDLTLSSRKKGGQPQGMMARKQEDQKLESAQAIAAPQQYQELKKTKEKIRKWCTRQNNNGKLCQSWFTFGI